jgi:hypothetical protein
VELGLRDDRCELLVWMRVSFALVDVNWRLHQIDSRVGGLARQQLPLSPILCRMVQCLGFSGATGSPLSSVDEVFYQHL